MVSFRDEVDDPEVEFVRLELEHFRTVAKDNQVKKPEQFLPADSNYNRSDRLAFDLSPITRPALTKPEFRALNVRPYWEIYWDDKLEFRVRQNPKSLDEHHVEVYDVQNRQSLVHLANHGKFDQTIGHVIILTTSPGGDDKRHKVGLKAFEAGLESELVEYHVMGAW